MEETVEDRLKTYKRRAGEWRARALAAEAEARKLRAENEEIRASFAATLIAIKGSSAPTGTKSSKFRLISAVEAHRNQQNSVNGVGEEANCLNCGLAVAVERGLEHLLGCLGRASRCDACGKTFAREEFAAHLLEMSSIERAKSAAARDDADELAELARHGLDLAAPGGGQTLMLECARLGARKSLKFLLGHRRYLAQDPALCLEAAKLAAANQHSKMAALLEKLALRVAPDQSIMLESTLSLTSSWD